MKLRNHQFSTPPQTSKSPIMKWEDKPRLIKPNPPTAEAIKRAKFRDKTFHWNSSVRSGNQRIIER